MDLLTVPWTLDFNSGIPVYRQIVHFMQAAVADGRMGEGDQLPTIRALHEKLDVNPNTVARAYRELAHLGLITTEQGSGCFVAPPAGPPPRLPANQRQAKLSEMCSRFAAEARSHGISLEELVRHLNQETSHA